jgi:hypothetical protein
MMKITQESLQANSPRAAAKFLQLYAQNVEGVDEKRWNFWVGWDGADREAGHFSQDEINWLTDCFFGTEKLADDPDSFRGILEDMRKGQRG